MRKHKNSQSTFQKNNFMRHVNLLLLEEKVQSHYVLIKYFKTFMHSQTLHRDRKHFCCYCL